MYSFEGKVVIITGSSTGIGKAIAYEYGKSGAKIVIIARNLKTLNDTVNDYIINGINKNNILTINVDISNDNSAKIIIEETIKKFGKLDILINNAGVNTKPGIKNFEMIELYDYINNINVRAVIKLTEEAIPYLKKTKGNIINISSISSRYPLRTTIYYSMSKSALDIYTKGLAGRLANDGIRVNSINPGFVETPIFTKNTKQEGKDIRFDEMIEKMKPIIENKVPLRRFGKPKEIAKLVLFISSDDASYCTGANYVIDGASSGIGKATALKYGLEGGKIVIVARNSNNLNETVENFVKLGVPLENILKIEIDISNDNAPSIIVEKVISHFGKIDILINNAGVVGKEGISNEESIELFDHIFRINVRGLIQLSEYTIPYLKKTKGNIVNISSIASSTPGSFSLYYRMSKAAVDIYTQSLAGKLGEYGVRVNSVNPGMTATKIFTTLPSVDGLNISEEDMLKNFQTLIDNSVPLKRIGSPDEIANVICFLSSDEGSYITGSCYIIDGGFKVSCAMSTSPIDRN
ncbi:Short-chain dehydrogenase/reductase SDR family and Glucose/ribitol dehydrogenase family and NAD(P)-binding domain-containing protein [Strongyloides ratti]|uniref:Short-chain dehydrogenase/reductase SDR family and Glucose/ribitol dehydrogenase family and NAD(P)-binding domain-containing protein n=1 Tax=Strongyloides ratti TaxID=34506 RepID=A0A090LNC1_STRRB|nr:Short-chain dehydrogenase/reductase SDR family and Glucose/ribitol dehydrogenase family and NAD(P)-binding domain-containing protein [Strongyloides ratti]CEF69669.1 Short-chain dehydrogenase/reductase SDR family and Glucose/ribitol dehydrogenase family and NAD(P)-binding domain-containing protein [Strongyloides ratti]